MTQYNSSISVYIFKTQNRLIKLSIKNIYKIRTIRFAVQLSVLIPKFQLMTAGCGQMSG